jgi:hypothetical protein
MSEPKLLQTLDTDTYVQIADIYSLLMEVGTPKAQAISASLAKVKADALQSRKDICEVQIFLMQAALVLGLHPKRGSQALAAIETARKCLSDSAKTFKDYLDEDLIKDLERRFEEERDGILECLSGVLTPEQMANLRAKLVDGDEEG